MLAQKTIAVGWHAPRTMPLRGTFGQVRYVVALRISGCGAPGWRREPNVEFYPFSRSCNTEHALAAHWHLRDSCELGEGTHT